jgi:formyl-CoA transferase
MEQLDRQNIPCMRVNRLEDLMDDPHLKQSGFFEERDHPTEARYVTLKHPVRFSRCETPFRLHAPRLGADGREVLAEIGIDSDTFDQLLAEGAVALPAEDKPV